MLQVELKNRAVAAVEACAAELKAAALQAASHIQKYIVQEEAAIEVAISNGEKVVVDASNAAIVHLGEDCKCIPVLNEVISELHRLLGQNPAPAAAPAAPAAEPAPAADPAPAAE